MAKSKVVDQPRVVEIKESPLFKEALQKYGNDSRVMSALIRFMEFKKLNPTAAFGGKDRFFAAGALKGILHAGLTFDISVIYKVTGANPTIVYLYTIASHDESGTGTPSNQKRQAQLRKRIDQQPPP